MTYEGTCRINVCFRSDADLTENHLAQNLVIDHHIRKRTAKPGVLLFQIFQAFGLIGLQVTLLLAPTKKGLLDDAELPADLSDGAVLGSQHFGFPQLVRATAHHREPASDGRVTFARRACVTASGISIH